MKLRFAHKIFLMPLLAAIAFVLILVSTQMLSRANRQILVEIETGYLPALELSRDLVEMLAKIQHELEGSVAIADEEELLKIDDLKDQFIKRIETEPDNTVVKDDELQGILNRFNAYYPLARRTTLSMILQEGDISLQGNLKEMAGKYNGLKDMLNEFAAERKQEMREASHEAHENLDRSNSILSLVMVVCIIVLLVLSWITISAVVKQMRESLDFVQKLSEGDLTASITTQGSDEVAALQQAMKDMARKLLGMVNKIKDSAMSVASLSEQMRENAQNMLSDATSQARDTEQSATSITEMSQSIMDVAKNASDAAQASSAAAQTAQDGKDVVESTVQGMREIQRTVKNSSETIEKLGQSSASIGTIVSVINDIADQTNLLALNAAIEAARAGEQGRGFAVVADEVRKLSERTARATSEIVEMIDGIQADTNHAMTSMEEGKQRVAEGLEMGEKASDSLDQIVNVSAEGSRMVQNIAAASEEQSATVDLIAQSMDDISSVTLKSKAAAEDVKNSSDSLSSLSEDLITIIKWFKT